MKERLLFTGLMMLFGIGCFAQQQKLDFAQKKIANEGYTVYFEVVNVVDENHAQQILNDLLSDNNVLDGRYFKSGAGKDRYQLYINNLITASYIKNILLSNNVDYDYSTIIVDGVNPEHNYTPGSNLASKGFNVSASGFPSYDNTGNKEVDDENYRKSKEEWIQENPEEYESLLKEIENNNK